MITCPLCGRMMEIWQAWRDSWYWCHTCRLAAHLDTLEKLRAELTETRFIRPRRKVCDGPLFGV